VGWLQLPGPALPLLLVLGEPHPLDVPDSSRFSLTRAEKGTISSFSPLLKFPLSTIITAVQWLIL